MTDNSTADHLNTEALYAQVTGLVYDVIYDMKCGKETFNEDDLRRALDSILAVGKIIGRQGALKDQPRMPVQGEIWRDRLPPLGEVEILAVHPTDSVTFRRLQCSHPAIPHRTGDHQGRVFVAAFLRLYEPTTPANDRLIEDWTKIVEADIR
jgi:hypothetical protein